MAKAHRIITTTSLCITPRSTSSSRRLFKPLNKPTRFSTRAAHAGQHRSHQLKQQLIPQRQSSTTRRKTNTHRHQSSGPQRSVPNLQPFVLWLTSVLTPYQAPLLSNVVTIVFLRKRFQDHRSQPTGYQNKHQEFTTQRTSQQRPFYGRWHHHNRPRHRHQSLMNHPQSLTFRPQPITAHKAVLSQTNVLLQMIMISQT